MFFYDNKRLVQSRLYPQGCDYGCREVYDDYFSIIYPTFEEFKKAMGEYYYQTYYQDYY